MVITMIKCYIQFPECLQSIISTIYTPISMHIAIEVGSQDRSIPGDRFLYTTSWSIQCN